MLEQIYQCQKCSLCYNQRPLLENEKKCQIFWVGLSAKRVLSDIEGPLSPDTNTGMLIQKIEEMCNDVVTYKTNLVKCLPLTEQQKLRYPNSREINCCIGHLLDEINVMSPKIVFLLGEKVYSSVGKQLKIKFEKWEDFEYCYKEHKGIYYVPIHHPSYVYVYKRKKVDEYIKSVERMIGDLLQ